MLTHHCRKIKSTIKSVSWNKICNPISSKARDSSKRTIVSRIFCKTLPANSKLPPMESSNISPREALRMILDKVQGMLTCRPLWKICCESSELMWRSMREIVMRVASLSIGMELWPELRESLTSPLPMVPPSLPPSLTVCVCLAVCWCARGREL
jgi:hypothetical protein